MTGLDQWLAAATRCLASDAAAQVRAEIREHFDATVAECGAAGEEAERRALAALGDPRVANRQYRKVLLTRAEAQVLREGGAEARLFCSRPWLKRLLFAVPAVLVAAGILLWPAELGRMLCLGGLVMGFLFAAPFLPIYTAARGRAFRIVKWVLLLGVLAVAMLPGEWWLFAACAWPAVWTEWMRHSIRRKLRVAEWPRHLYL